MQKQEPSLQRFLSKNSAPLFILLSILTWIYVFRGFLTNELAIVKDSVAYWEHMRFFIVNLSQGVFPQWDPTFSYGVPIEFFLRRIGNYNPLFLSVLILFKMGVPMKIAYLIFLVFYYFLGMIAFYLIAKKVFKDTYAAFLAFLLLSFSSISTLLFFSFIVYVFVPIFWFVYFLIAFCENQQRYNFIGLLFCLMINFSTYIPFYFLTIILTIIVCFMILYFRSFLKIVKKFIFFIKNNKGTFFVALLILLISLGPGLMLFKTASEGHVALPGRHVGSDSENVFTVGERLIRGGDAVSQLYFDRLISNIDNLELGVVYIPIFAYLILLLGLVTRLNRKIVLLSTCASLIFLIILTNMTPIYAYLYQHVFYFKYIRQLYHFFWLAVLPLIILIVSEQFRSLLHVNLSSNFSKITASIYVMCAHLGLGIYLMTRENIIWSSYVVVALSLIASFYFFVRQPHLKDVKNGKGKGIFYILIFLLVVAQPLQAYHYLNKNVQKSSNYPSMNQSQYSFKFIEERVQEDLDESVFVIEQKAIYYGTFWYTFLYTHLDLNVLRDYLSRKLLIYDDVEVITDEPASVERIKKFYSRNSNKALVSEEVMIDGLSGRNRTGPVQVINEETEEFELIDYTVNSLKFRTNFSTPKFLVYNDSYHKGWRAFLNNERTKVYRANVAFKGVVLPAGENTVTLSFLSPKRYILGYFYLLLFAATFCWLLLSWSHFIKRAGTGNIRAD